MVINPYLSGPLSVSHHQRTSCKESLIQLNHKKKGGFSGLCGAEHGYLQEGLTIHPLGWTVLPYRTLFFLFSFFFSILWGFDQFYFQRVTLFQYSKSVFIISTFPD